MKYQSPEAFLNHVAARNPGQGEYLQAVTEVIESLWSWISQHPQYSEQGLLDRLVEPERVIQFRVAWVDDHGEWHAPTRDDEEPVTPEQLADLRRTLDEAGSKLRVAGGSR